MVVAPILVVILDIYTYTIVGHFLLMFKVLYYQGFFDEGYCDADYIDDGGGVGDDTGGGHTAALAAIGAFLMVAATYKSWLNLIYTCI